MAMADGGEVVAIHPLELRRRREGFTREALAAESMIAVRTIYGIEREGRKPNRATVRMLADALGCKPKDIA